MVQLNGSIDGCSWWVVLNQGNLVENGSANNFLWIQLALEGKLSFTTKSSAKIFFNCEIWLQMRSSLLTLKTKSYDLVNKKDKLKIHKKRLIAIVSIFISLKWSIEGM